MLAIPRSALFKRVGTVMVVMVFLHGFDLSRIAWSQSGAPAPATSRSTMGSGITSTTLPPSTGSAAVRPPRSNPLPSAAGITRYRARITGPEEGTTSLAFSADGKRLISGGADHAVYVWNVPDLSLCAKLLGHGTIVADAAISPDGSRGVSLDIDNVVIVWDVGRKAPLHTFKAPRPVRNVRFSGNSQVFLSMGPDLQSWNLDQEKPDRIIPTGNAVWTVNISPSGKRAVTTHSDVGMVRVWDLATGAKLAEYRHRSSRRDPLSVPIESRASLLVLQTAFFTDEERILVTSYDIGPYVWTWGTSSPADELELHWAGQTCWASTGSLFLMSEGSYSVHSVDMELKKLDEDPQRSGRVADVKIDSEKHNVMAAQGPWVALAGGGTWQKDDRNGTDFSWKREGTWHPNHHANIVIVDKAEFSKEITDGRDKLVKISQSGAKQADDARIAFENGAATTQQLAQLQSILLKESTIPVESFGEHPGGIFSMAFSPDGKILATAGGDHFVRLYDFATRKELKNFKGHSDFVTDVCFSADGKHLLSAGWDGSLLLWNVASGTIEHRIKTPEHVVRGGLTPDMKVAVTCGAHVISLWDMAREKNLHQIEVDGNIHGLSISPKGIIATGEEDGMVTIWDSKTAQPINRHNFNKLVRGVFFESEELLWIAHSPGPDIGWNLKTDQIVTTKQRQLEVDLMNEDVKDPGRKIYAIMDKSSVPNFAGYGPPLYDPTGKYCLNSTPVSSNEDGLIAPASGKIELLDAKKIHDLSIIQLKLSRQGR